MRADTLALVDLVGSATLWAVTVTVCDVGILKGAVYRPAEEIVPTDGLMDQVTAVLLVPKTVAVNCCVPEGAKADSGWAEGHRDRLEKCDHCCRDLRGIRHACGCDCNTLGSRGCSWGNVNCSRRSARQASQSRAKRPCDCGVGGSGDCSGKCLAFATVAKRLRKARGKLSREE